MIGEATIYKERKKHREEAAAAGSLIETEVTSEASFIRISKMSTLLNVEQIEMEFGYSLIPLVDESSGGTLSTVS